MFQIFPICIIFLNLHTMSPLQISDICRQSLLSIHFLQTIIQTLCRSHFQHQLEKQSFNVVYIDIFCRHLQTLFMSLFSFHNHQKLLFSVQFFVNNCSSQIHRLLAVYVDIILGLCRQFCRHFCSIVYSQSSSYRHKFCLCRHFQIFVDTFVVLK